MNLLIIALTAVAVILAAITAWYQRQSNRLQARLIALQATVDEIRRFDQATARNFLAQARMLDHDSWEIGEIVKDYFSAVSSSKEKAKQLESRLLLKVGGVHKLALANFRTMVRVYQLSGDPITNDLVNRWISEEFVPDHYRAFMLSQVTKPGVD